MPATRFVCYFSGTRRGFSATSTTTRFVSRARWHHNTPRLPRARYKKLSVRSNASYPGSGDALAAQRETRPVSAALFLRCRERTTREKRLIRAAPIRRRRIATTKARAVRTCDTPRVFDDERTREGVKIAPSKLRGPSRRADRRFWVFGFLGFWVFGFLASSSPRRFGFSPPERRSALRWRTFVERRGFARAASRARRGSRVNVARRTAGRRDVARHARRLRGASSGCASPATETGASDCGARITDAGGFLRRGRRARGSATSRRSRRGASSGFLRAAPRARLPGEPRRGHAGPAVAGAPPFFGPGLCPLGAGIAAWLPGAIGLLLRRPACAGGTVPVARGRRLLLAAGGWPYGWP